MALGRDERRAGPIVARAADPPHQLWNRIVRSTGFGAVIAQCTASIAAWAATMGSPVPDSTDQPLGRCLATTRPTYRASS